MSEDESGERARGESRREEEVVFLKRQSHGNRLTDLGDPTGNHFGASQQVKRDGGLIVLVRFLCVCTFRWRNQTGAMARKKWELLGRFLSNNSAVHQKQVLEPCTCTKTTYYRLSGKDVFVVPKHRYGTSVLGSK